MHDGNRLVAKITSDCIYIWDALEGNHVFFSFSLCICNLTDAKWINHDKKKEPTQNDTFSGKTHYQNKKENTRTGAPLENTVVVKWKRCIYGSLDVSTIYSKLHTTTTKMRTCGGTPVLLTVSSIHSIYFFFARLAQVILMTMNLLRVWISNANTKANLRRHVHFTENYNCSSRSAFRCLRKLSSWSIHTQSFFSLPRRFV